MKTNFTNTKSHTSLLLVLFFNVLYIGATLADPIAALDNNNNNNSPNERRTDEFIPLQSAPISDPMTHLGLGPVVHPSVPAPRSMTTTTKNPSLATGIGSQAGGAPSSSSSISSSSSSSSSSDPLSHRLIFGADRLLTPPTDHSPVTSSSGNSAGSSQTATPLILGSVIPTLFGLGPEIPARITPGPDSSAAKTSGPDGFQTGASYAPLVGAQGGGVPPEQHHGGIALP